MGTSKIHPRSVLATSEREYILGEQFDELPDDLAAIYLDVRQQCFDRRLITASSDGGGETSSSSNSDVSMTDDPGDDSEPATPNENLRLGVPEGGKPTGGASGSGASAAGVQEGSGVQGDNLESGVPESESTKSDDTEGDDSDCPGLQPCCAESVQDSTLTYDDMGSVIRRDGIMLSLTQNVVENYVRMICAYVNRVRLQAAQANDTTAAGEASAERPSRRRRSASPAPRARSRGSRSPDREQNMGTEAARRQRSPAPRPRTPPTPDAPPPGPSCAYITQYDLEDLQDDTNRPLPDRTDAVDTLLDKLNLGAVGSRQPLLELDYLFVPWLSAIHQFLVGMAPKQKFFFALDSSQGTTTIKDWPITGLLLLALEQISRTELDEGWHMYGQWWEKEAQDGSPDVVRQRDYYNCGVFTATNCMCLAFGYDLLWARDKEDMTDLLDDGKRPRMSMELYHGGFDSHAAFNYNLIELPKRVDDTPQAEEPESPSTGTERVTSSAALRADEEDEGDTGMEQSGFVEMRRDWPAQFRSSGFRKSGFLYSISPGEVAFWGKLKTRRELVKACVDRGVEGYEKVCVRAKVVQTVGAAGDDTAIEEALEDLGEREIGLFRRWCENYCAASRAIVQADGVNEALRVLPIPGLGRREVAQFVL